MARQWRIEYPGALYHAMCCLGVMVAILAGSVGKKFSEFDSDLLIDKASRILEFNLEAARHTKKIGVAEKDKHDLLVYLLWKTGRLSNREIGAYFGLTYSAISRRVKIINDRISAEKRLKKQYQTLKSQIKV